MMCRPPRKGARLERMQPSLAFPIQCRCGYCFRSTAQAVDHQKAYERLG